MSLMEMKEIKSIDELKWSFQNDAEYKGIVFVKQMSEDVNYRSTLNVKRNL